MKSIGSSRPRGPDDDTRSSNLRLISGYRLTIRGWKSGEGVLKQIIALSACLLAVNVVATAGALAQTLPPPVPYPGVAYPSTKVWLPPHEITAIVRSTGLKPLHRPARHGATYAVRALAPTGEQVRVVLDARVGIVRIDPVRMPIYAMPATPDGPRLGMVPMQAPVPPAAAQTSPPSGAHPQAVDTDETTALATPPAGSAEKQE
jgi:hypothetical protein